ncbi:MAG: DUF1559 domain-containing protein [Planctomycetales bacterium]
MKGSGCLKVLVVTFIGGMAFFIWIGVLGPVEIAVGAVVGWALFLAEVIPKLSVSWSGVATAIVSLLLFVVGFHRLAAWYTGVVARRDIADGAPQVAWKWRWSVLIAATVLLMFVAGIAVVGVAHQSIWILTGDQPLMSNNFAEFRRSESRENLHQIGVGLDGYHNSFRKLPAGGTFDRQGRPLHGWQTSLLPFINEEALFDRIDRNVPWDDPQNSPAFRTIVKLYMNPVIKSTDERQSIELAVSHYAGNGWVLGGGTGIALSSIKDGAANTLFSGEVNSRFKPWGHPVNWRDPGLGLNTSVEGFGGPWNGGGTMFLMGDGSVRFLSGETNREVLKALATPDGGEPVRDY